MSEHTHKVTPVPTAFSFGLDTTTAEDGTRIIVFQLQTVTGNTTVFMPAEFAMEMGRQLTQAGSGLVLPKSEIVPTKRTNG